MRRSFGEHAQAVGLQPALVLAPARLYRLPGQPFRLDHVPHLEPGLGEQGEAVVLKRAEPEMGLL